MPYHVLRMHTAVETPSYIAEAERIFSVEERAAIVDLVSDDPQRGVVIPGKGVFASCV
jgi:hypothetical protein